MQKYTRTIDFDKHWNAFYGIIKLIGGDLKNKSIDKYSYALYDRALYLYDAHVSLEKSNNITVLLIFSRCLYEIKILASKYQDDKEMEISNSNLETKNEIERFFKMIKSGNSFTSQLLWKFFENKKMDIEFKTDGIKNKRETIKNNAEKADLGFDYEILYWLSSLFIHCHPLSLVIEHKEQYPDSEIFEALNILSRDIDLLNINVLGTLLWITTYLHGEMLSENTKVKIDEMWTAIRQLISHKNDIEWKVDEKMDLGTVKFMSGDEIILQLKRKQRK